MMFKKVTQKVIEAPFINELFQEALDNKNETVEAPKLVSFVNPYSYMVLRNNPDACKCVDVFYSDALVSCWAFSLIARRKIPRISFDYGSFAKTFLEQVSQSGHSVYFIGAKDSEVVKTIESFRQTYPLLKIAGYRHGYFSSDEERREVAQMVAASGASFVVCGMGTPHQEKFGLELKSAKGSIKQIYTCGGFLHQSSEHVQYYPEWINRYNLRWLYRAFKEDYVLKRLLVQYPQFLLIAFVDRWKR